MALEVWQERVVHEKEELDAKIDKLLMFIGSEQFESLDAEDKLLLRCQRDDMLSYSKTLGRRIVRFQQPHRVSPVVPVEVPETGAEMGKGENHG